MVFLTERIKNFSQYRLNDRWPNRGDSRMSAPAGERLPRRSFATPGPCGQALMDTPVRDVGTDGEAFTGIDRLGAIRSFDPCMVRATRYQSLADAPVKGRSEIPGRPAYPCSRGSIKLTLVPLFSGVL